MNYKKKIITVVLILLTGFKINAQITAYYKNIQESHSNSIIESTKQKIITTNEELSCIYYFNTSGICKRVVMIWKDASYNTLKRMLNDSPYTVWSDQNKNWHNTSTGDDGNLYSVITKIEYNMESKPYINIYILKKIEIE